MVMKLHHPFLFIMTLPRKTQGFHADPRPGFHCPGHSRRWPPVLQDPELTPDGPLASFLLYARADKEISHLLVSTKKINHPRYFGCGRLYERFRLQTRFVLPNCSKLKSNISLPFLKICLDSLHQMSSKLCLY